MKNSGKFKNPMRAVTINCEFSLPGLMFRDVDAGLLGLVIEDTEPSNCLVHDIQCWVAS